MKKWVLRLVCAAAVATLAAIAAPEQAVAQGRSSDTITRTWGLGVSFAGSQTNIQIPIWVAQRVIIAPHVGVWNTENVGSVVHAGAMLRFFRRIQRVSPYFGIGFGADFTVPNGGSTVTDLYGAACYGGEFFLHNNFSFGLEARVTVTVPEFGNRALHTSSVFYGNLYF